MGAELRDPQYILYGFARAKALQTILQLREAFFGNGRIRLHDVRIARGAQQFLAEHQNQTPRLGRRVEGLETGGAVADEIGQEH